MRRKRRRRKDPQVGGYLAGRWPRRWVSLRSVDGRFSYMRLPRRRYGGGCP